MRDTSACCFVCFQHVTAIVQHCKPGNLSVLWRSASRVWVQTCPEVETAGNCMVHGAQTLNPHHLAPSTHPLPGPQGELHTQCITLMLPCCKTVQACHCYCPYYSSYGHDMNAVWLLCHCLLCYVLQELVQPSAEVVDYRTELTGISAAQLAGVSTDRKAVAKRIKKLLKPGTVLVGHSLQYDLQALQLDHQPVIDTALLFSYE